MASSSAPRLRLACDACTAAAWVGPVAGSEPGAVPAPRSGPASGSAPASGPGEFDAWCEACQRPQRLARGAAAKCAACGGPLCTGAPRFAELWGELQELDAVLAAWVGDAGPLATLLPERPRFLTDLAPPAPSEGDPAPVREALEAARRGDWAAVLASAESNAPRALAARAIAHERRGETEAALADWTHALAAGEDARARLARGALHARAKDWDAAAADFALAGAGREARWDRAALRVHRAVATTPGLPDVAEIAAARAEAGPASAFWSEPTVGRLAFTLLAERALARREAGELGDLDLGALREGEDLLEHATFWDRALVLVAHARLGQDSEGDAGRIARPLARELASRLLAEPPLAGAALAEARVALERTWDAIAAFEPRDARAALAPWLADERLRRYRLPCAACGRGSVGADAWDEGGVAAGRARE